MDRLPVDLLQSVSLSNVPVRSHFAAASTNAVVAAWRRRWLICVITTLSLAGAAVSLVVLKKQYLAEAVLQLNLDKPEHSSTEDRGTAVVLDATSMVQGELRIIRSRLVARRVVEALHLAETAPGMMPETGPKTGPKTGPEMGPEMAPPVATGPTGAVAGMLGPLREALGRLLARLPDWVRRPVASGNADPAQRVQAAEDEVMGHMTADSDNRSYMIAIRFASTDPARAAQVANALAEEYIARRLETNVEAAAKTAEWVDGQIRQVRQQLHEAEAAVEAYRTQSGLIEVGASETLDQQRLRDLAVQRSAAVLARDDAEARLNRVSEILRTNGVPSFEDLKGSPQILTLLDRRNDARSKLKSMLTELGSQHPLAVQAQAAVTAAETALSAELRHSTAILGAELAAAQRAEQDATSRLAELQQAMIAGKEREAELRTRQASITALQSRLAALTRNREQLDAIQQLRPVAATLIVPAEVPRAPVSPKPIVLVPLALSGGLAFGVLLASVLERRDNGFGSGAEVEPALGKRCLGMVPEVRRQPWQAKRRRDEFELSLQAETVRSVGAAMGLFDFSRTCRVVLVTSSVADEGKRVFCQAMAGCLADSGRRVLLVAGSPQRARPTRDDDGPDEFEPRPVNHKSGLTVLHRDRARSLACDVFGSTSLAREIETARGEFDVILLEGPAVMLVADSLVLGRTADSVIHVVRWASTKRATVNAALNRLYESSVGVDGVVLTRVDLARHAALRTTDLGAYYLKERRFYEQLLRPSAERLSDSTRDI